MRISAIIQARMGSNRLPGKVLMDIGGRPMLWHVINRLKYSKKLNDIVLAIPDSKENDVLEKFAQENKVKYFRGSEEDVLSRYYEAAKEVESDVIVRITSDCPLIDPKIVDLVIEKHLNSEEDYTSNVFKRTFPRGLDVEIFDFKLLEKAYRQAKEDYQREHVTPYIYEQSKVYSVESQERLKRPDLRLTVDTKEDLDLIRQVYKTLYFPGNIFYIEEVIDFLDEQPELLNINKETKQKELIKEISLKKADSSDIKFLWYLRNRPETREYSFQTQEVAWPEHMNWIKPVLLGLTDKGLFMIKDNKTRIGQIRFDRLSDKEKRISISILKEFQGKGLATKSLKLAIKEQKQGQRLIAEINKNNVASIGLFEKLNFKLKGNKGEWLKYYLENEQA